MRALLSVDNSQHSHNAVLETAKSLWPPDSELIVATSVTAPFGVKLPTTIPEAAVKFVEDTAQLIRAENAAFKSVETKVVLGNPRHEILKLVDELGVDLLILGSRKPDFSKLVFGSVSHQLLLSAHCSIRIARERKAHNRIKVLIGVDASEYSRLALQQVTGRPWPPQTEFVCLNAVPTLTESYYRSPDIFSVEELERGRHDLMLVATNELQKATEFLRSKLPDCSVKSEVVQGEPRDALVRAVIDFDADLMVLGSAALNFDAQVAVGSVSENVALQSDCSVEVVKMKARLNQSG